MRLVRALVVGAVREAEVRAAVEHVDVDRRARGEQRVELRGGVGRGGRVVVLAPVVEPAVPELAAHERPGRLVAAEGREALGGARAEGSGAVQLVEAAAREHLVGRLVDGRQRHDDAGLAREVDEVAEVVGVVAVRAVLVLDLHEDHGTAHVDLPRRDDLVDAAEELVDGREVQRLAATDAHRGILEQPARQPAAVPLGADVGAGAHDRVHALRVHEVEEAAEVEAGARSKAPRSGEWAFQATYVSMVSSPMRRALRIRSAHWSGCTRK